MLSLVQMGRRAGSLRALAHDALFLRDRVERVETHHRTLPSFLRRSPAEYSHFVLLDHQDGLAHRDPEALAEEWHLTLANRRRGTGVLMRSSSFPLDFLPVRAKRALRFFQEWTASLYPLDRVGTYASAHLAEVM